jgi:hypothetical protein
MKRLFILTLIVFFVSGPALVSANESPEKDGVEKAMLTSKAEPAITPTENKAEESEQKSSDKLISVYSMNRVLYVETTESAKILVYSLTDDYKETRIATGTLTVFPASRGTYIVEVGEDSKKVVVR